MRPSLLGLSLSLFPILAGCATAYHATDGRTFPGAAPSGPTGEARDDAVRASAVHDLPCDAASIEVGRVRTTTPTVYADGCGKRATYALNCELGFGHVDCPLLLTSEFTLPKP